MPLSANHPHTRLPQRTTKPNRRGKARVAIVRELDHELLVTPRRDGTVHLTVNGTTETLTAAQAARFGTMMQDAARRARASA